MRVEISNLNFKHVMCLRNYFQDIFLGPMFAYTTSDVYLNSNLNFEIYISNFREII
jgi:hypothetical protein